MLTSSFVGLTCANIQCAVAGTILSHAESPVSTVTVYDGKQHACITWHLEADS